ncbi:MULTISPECIES: multicopper oxidase family protein [Agrobacterium]|uniref:Multicopper oxidase domain-containing protein n=1 Tax=Agrobacterium pusense TaxID=648995 RepID=A0AA44ENQ0_9HYPH|nr:MULTISPECIES: multicopper oxidase domain-containing protein [Agrobacterium]NRF11386.1 multicopper oxidase domain-containing protein [Agrobacterium pusense]NRF22096.1 multicopper oxidase domain-containing protein [Agrobacterium pusense]CDN96473.1 Multicopper oxidase type 2 [Agrobacterium tumefaciens]
MTFVSRRGFLAASAAMLAASQFPVRAFAQDTTPLNLSASTRTLDINGRAATVFGLTGPSGSGLSLNPGERFRVNLTNNLPVSTIIHWHGQIPPHAQDGVPDAPMAALIAGETRSYDFEPQPGTHWMHSHIPIQEMQLLAAPLIVRRAGDVAADRQEVVILLHDFSFKSPEEVLGEITAGHGADHGAAAPMSGMGHGSMGGMPHGDMGAMSGMAMDLNDYDWDAYLANDRTLADPEVVQVERGGRVRLRIINGAAATVFWVDTGAVEGRLVAVDGHDVRPVTGSRFGVAMGQRLDIELDLPNESAAWPIFALREGARERTGIVLAAPGASVNRIADVGETDAAAFDVDLSQEAQLVALEALPSRSVGRRHMVMLGGTMQPYVWTIDGAVWGEHRPITAKSGERVELMFHNMSMMGHPMHLHGHSFQVVDINGRSVAGARRDTVYVPPMSMVTVALDAGEAANWMLHCHHMPHLATGMMTEFAVET